MSVHFKKKAAKTKQQIPTASLPDIIFMLLIFFMVTTVLREVTLRVQTRLPQAEAVQKIEQKRLVSYLYVGREMLTGRSLGDMRVQIDDALVNMEDVRFIMYRKLTEQPRLIVSLRVDQDAEMGFLTDVQQELREAGTLRVNYSTKRQASRAAG
jgi:biopolymer transport protein ExbD